MHEMSLAEGMRGVIEDAARAQGFARVRTVWLELGQLAAVEREALRFSFDVVMRGSLADGAALEIVEVPGMAWCMQCSESVPLAERGEPCPRCGSYQLQVTAGTEMRVKELEVV
jgi:hydrogenase nickel incorporation protein HypA/HybF